jgi:hypothetical protein
MKAKYLAVYMDHLSAQIMEYSSTPAPIRTIESAFTHTAKEAGLVKSEHIMHHKEQHLQADYYKKLGEIIKNYEEVLLFGPTDAKIELYNSLHDDQHFSAVKIEVKQTDKLTENQQHAFVRDYFSKSN